MSKVTIKEWYTRVNALWPTTVPKLTGPEAERAARKLYRFANRRTFVGKVRLASGNRYNRVYYKLLIINPESGWKHLVHDLSHGFHYNQTRRKPHEGKHARLEARMIKEVIRRGWLNGVLIPEPKPKAVVDPKVVRYFKVLNSIKRWESKLRRAETAIKKLNRQKRYYETKVIIEEKESEECKTN